MHCLNNLLQGPHFGPGDLAEIGMQLDKAERALVSRAESTGSDVGGGLEAHPYNVDSSADGGNFSIQVLSLALKRFALELVPSKRPDVRERMKDPATAANAFLCQYHDHWFAIRLVADCWWNLNSTRKKPAMVGPFYLAAWLSQLLAEGYFIFLVTGDSVPEPVKPLNEQKHNLENFHDILELLAKGKQSGGNLIATEPDSDSEAIQWQDSFGFANFPCGYADAGPEEVCSPSAHPDLGRELLETAKSSLRELGFKEPQIVIALELGSRNSDAASQLILNMPALDAMVEIEAASWAEAMQACVLGLDRSPAPLEFLSAHLLQLACLLSCDRQLQRVALEHLDLKVLTDCMSKILQHKAKDWASNAAKAGQAAEKLLQEAACRQHGEAIEEIFVTL